METQQPQVLYFITNSDGMIFRTQAAQMGLMHEGEFWATVMKRFPEDGKFFEDCKCLFLLQSSPTRYIVLYARNTHANEYAIDGVSIADDFFRAEKFFECWKRGLFLEPMQQDVLHEFQPSEEEFKRARRIMREVLFGLNDEVSLATVAAALGCPLTRERLKKPPVRPFIG